MSANDWETWDALIRKLHRLAPIDEADERAIRALPLTIEKVPRARHLIRDGDEADRCCMLVTGYACRHKTTSAGGRQIVSFHVPGDILDLQHLMLGRADHNVQTITEATVAWTPCAALKTLARQRPIVGEAMWRDTLIDASIFREWVLNVGRRDAKSRIAHMLCEFAARQRAAGLAEADRFVLPMTQEDIADATGLTPVHVNRMLQLLGEEGVISRDLRRVAIADWERMRQVADFDPAYLHGAAA